VQEGDFVGLIGPNGGGKSTLLKLIVNILPLQKGSIKLFNQDIKAFKNWSCIGYVSQNVTHFDRQFPATVWEVVSMGRFALKKPFRSLKKEDYMMIERSLADVDMLDYKNSPLQQLSGGQQQRVFIARALASNPCLLALDEPTIGVDLQAQEQFYLLLQKLRKEKHLTIILVSHDIDVIAAQATTFACLNQELIYHGEPKKFIKEDYLEKLYGKNLRLILHGH
ncbi:MAG: metal ABC transporter ATP-binding protein, partial [Candidatus Paceibacterales bacterium]